MSTEGRSNEESKNTQPVSDPDQSMIYQIRVKSHLNSDWTDWFEGLTITLEKNGHTLLTGPVGDQAALYGLLKKIRDLGMLLISVNCMASASTMLGSGPADAVDKQS